MKKIIVVKIGGSVTATNREKINTQLLLSLVKQAKALQKEDFVIVFVISGAVYFGEHILSLREEITDKRLAAGIGQAYLTAALYDIFSSQKMIISQMLIEKEDVSDEEKSKSLLDVFTRAIEKNIIMVLNENDILDLNSFAGNDFLASYVAKLLHADSLFILTDVAGVYGKDTAIIKTIEPENDIAIAKMREGRAKKGIGGMQGKILAATDAANAGIKTVIASGKVQNVLIKLAKEEDIVCTTFLPKK